MTPSRYPESLNNIGDDEGFPVYFRSFDMHIIGIQEDVLDSWTWEYVLSGIHLYKDDYEPDQLHA